MISILVVKVRWISVLHRFSTLLGYVWQSISRAGKNWSFLVVNQQPSVSNWQLPHGSWTCLVIYGGQFPQLEEQTVPGSEPATFRLQLTITSSQRRRVSRLKVRRLHHTAMEALSYSRRKFVQIFRLKLKPRITLQNLRRTSKCDIIVLLSNFD